MLFLYFSGTGNTRYCMEYFANALGKGDAILSIEQEEAIEQIRIQKNIVFGYPVYYSNIPKIVRDYIETHSKLWVGKHIFLIATMGMFSGDGTGVAARLFKKKGAYITGGIHLVMPDCILDVKLLKKTEEENADLVRRAREKMDRAVRLYQHKRPPREGLHWWNHIAGLFGQRLYFYGKTKNYTDKLKINRDKCIGCGLCASSCPMENIRIKEKKVISRDKCTMCYRCVNHCPQKAITLIGERVVAEPFTDY